MAKSTNKTLDEVQEVLKDIVLVGRTEELGWAEIRFRDLWAKCGDTPRWVLEKAVNASLQSAGVGDNPYTSMTSNSGFTLYVWRFDGGDVRGEQLDLVLNQLHKQEE